MMIYVFFTPKIWPAPKKIAKNMKNIPIDSFLVPLFESFQNIDQKFVSDSRNFAETVMWSYPFQVKVSRKKIQLDRDSFFHTSTISGLQMMQHWSRDSWFGRLLGALKVPKNLAIPKIMGKSRQHLFWTISTFQGLWIWIWNQNFNKNSGSQVIKFDDFVCPQLYSRIIIKIRIKTPIFAQIIVNAISPHPNLRFWG